MDLRIPLYLQLKNTLLNRIDNGELLPGERLESERDLAEKIWCEQTNCAFCTECVD